MSAARRERDRGCSRDENKSGSSDFLLRLVENLLAPGAVAPVAFADSGVVEAPAQHAAVLVFFGKVLRRLRRGFFDLVLVVHWFSCVCFVGLLGEKPDPAVKADAEADADAESTDCDFDRIPNGIRSVRVVFRRFAH